MSGLCIFQCFTFATKLDYVVCISHIRLINSTILRCLKMYFKTHIQCNWRVEQKTACANYIENFKKVKEMTL